MKIGIFTDCYSPQVNGVVTSVLMLEKELMHRGHEVTIITVNVPDYKDTKKNIIRLPSIPFTPCKGFRLGLPFAPETRKTIKNLGFDLIHTHTEFTIGLLGKHLAKVLNIPLLHTYHTMYEDYSHYLYGYKHGQSIVKKIIIKGCKHYIKHYDGIIAPTDKTRSALLRYGVTNDIYVIPTGIDLGQFHHYPPNHPKIVSICHSLGLSPSDDILLSLGRLSEEKSIDRIIRQIPLLKIRKPNIKLLIVGDGPYRFNLEALCIDLQIEDSVIFTGEIPFDEINYYYSIASLFISASKTETQGLTILEAMACRVPVIVYNDSNIKGIVIHNYSGRLFLSNNELFEMIMEHFAHLTSSSILVNNAYEIIQNLSTESYGTHAEEVYRHLLNA